MSLPAFDMRGQGDVAVLLLHGIGGGRSIWDDASSGTACALAAAGYQALAVDLPGYGDSQALGPPDLANMVDAVAALIRHTAAARTVLLGHSMGGMVAQELLARLGPTAPTPVHGLAHGLIQGSGQGSGQGLVHGLVLACTSASFGQADGDWQARFVADRLAPLDAGLGMPGMARKLVPAMVSPSASDDAVQVAIAVMSKVPEASYRSALAAIVAFDRRANLSHIHMPVLCLAADDDRTAPPEVMRRMAARLPQGEFASLPAAGHIANVEQPAAFNAAVLSFLTRHFPLAQGVVA